MPGLKVEYKAVTLSTRIPELLAGNIDMECGTTTNSKQRQQQVGSQLTTMQQKYAWLLKRTLVLKVWQT